MLPWRVKGKKGAVNDISWQDYKGVILDPIFQWGFKVSYKNESINK